MSVPTAWQSQLTRDARKSPIVALTVLSGIALVIWVFFAGLFGMDTGTLPIVVLAFIVYAVTAVDIRLGLAMTVVSVGISPEFTVAGIPNLRLEDFLMPVLTVGWIGRLIFLRQRLEPSPLYKPLVLGLFLAVLSTLQNAAYAHLDLAASAPRFAKEVEWLFMFLVTFHVIRTREEARGFVFLLLAASASVGLYGLFQTLATADQAEYRIPGPPGETANILGGYLVFHIAIALGITASNPKMRKLSIPCFLVMFIPLMRTLSRSSYVALFGSLVVLFLIRRGRFVGTLLVASFLALAFSSAGERFSTILTIFSAPPPSWEARVLGWQAILGDLPQAPLLGLGLGSVQLGHADSEIVRRLIETGLLGFCTFAWLLFVSFRTGIAVMRKAEDPVLSGFGLGYVAGLAGLVVHAVAATTFTSIRPVESFFLATGLLCAIAARHIPRPEAAAPHPIAPPAPLISRRLPPRPGSSR
ncbi:MAG: O-antigen ligase family protein [Planctomycetes bacterium]|nr:O-antigen ligase family protein [Planctomycetota bacterium]